MKYSLFDDVLGLQCNPGRLGERERRFRALKQGMNDERSVALFDALNDLHGLPLAGIPCFCRFSLGSQRFRYAARA